MTASYTPFASPKDRIRHNVGDTDMDNPLRQDEDYEAALAYVEGNELRATSIMAGGLAVEYGQEPVRISDDGTTIDWGDRVKTWLSISDNSFDRANAASTSGGVSSQAGMRGPVVDRAEFQRPNWWTPS